MIGRGWFLVLGALVGCGQADVGSEEGGNGVSAPTSVGNSCPASKEGAERCDGDAVVICSEARWQLYDTCESGKECRENDSDGAWCEARSSQSAPPANTLGGSSASSSSNDSQADEDPTGSSSGSSSSNDGSNNAIAGDLVGQPVPADSMAIVLWWVYSVSPDINFKYGEGWVADQQFAVTLPQTLPAPIANYGTLGIANLAFVPGATSIVDGTGPVGFADVNENGEMDEPLLSRELIVWRAPGSTQAGWAAAFEDGYSCAQCGADSDGDGFDDLEPISCEDIVMVVIPGYEYNCNFY